MFKNSEIQSTSQVKQGMPGYTITISSILFAVTYSILVYERYTGLNCLLLGLLVQAGIHFSNLQNKGSLSYYAAQLASTLLAASVALYGYQWVMVLVWGSWAIAKYYAEDRNGGTLLEALAAGNLHFLENMYNFGPLRTSNKSVTTEPYVNNKVSAYTLAAGVLILFYAFYYMASPGFAKASDFVFDMVSLTLILFCFTGLLLACGFMGHKQYYTLESFFSIAGYAEDETASETNSHTFLSGSTGIIRFILMALIAMAVVAAASDDYLLYHTYIATHSSHAANATSLVHQNVGGLILAIISAIILIVSVHKGLGSHEQAIKPVKTLLLAYLAVNIWLIANASFSNWQYVASFGLTHKRIGVFINSLVIVCGLGLTAAFIYKGRSIKWLFNSNSWAVYAAVVFYILMPWDVWVAQSLLKQPAKEMYSEYILKLDSYSLPVIKQHEQKLLSVLDSKQRVALARKFTRLKNNNTNRSDFRDWKLADKWAEASLNQAQ